jgi:hypothetical protein
METRGKGTMVRCIVNQAQKRRFFGSDPSHATRCTKSSSQLRRAPFSIALQRACPHLTVRASCGAGDGRRHQGHAPPRHAPRPRAGDGHRGYAARGHWLLTQVGPAPRLRSIATAPTAQPPRRDARPRSEVRVAAPTTRRPTACPRAALSLFIRMHRSGEPLPFMPTGLRLAHGRRSAVAAQTLCTSSTTPGRGSLQARFSRGAQRAKRCGEGACEGEPGPVAIQHSLPCVVDCGSVRT